MEMRFVCGKYWPYNLGQNICILFQTELDCYQNTVTVRVTKRLKIWDFRKLGKFNKIPERLGFDDKYTPVHTKAKFWCFPVKNCKKSAVT